MVEKAREQKFDEDWNASVKGALAGKFFHSFMNGEIDWQGVVECRVERGIYLVKTFEWLSGADYCSKLVRVSDMSEWNFYDTADDMNVYYRNHPRQREEAEA